MTSLLIIGGTSAERFATSQKHNTNPQLAFTLDGRQETLRISAVKEFQKNISLTPTHNQTQTHFILESQHLSLPAQNALLKILEEPPPSTQIILTADSRTSLIETIISRCQLVVLKKDHHPNSDSGKQLLRDILTSNHAQLIKLAKTTSETDPEALISSLLSFISASHKSKATTNREKAIILIHQSLKDLRTNINQQLLLENLFFKLKHLSST